MKPRFTNPNPLSSRTRAASSPPAAASVRGSQGTKAEVSLTINCPAQELFAFWRNFENLPQVMEHVAAVKCLDERRSQWQVWRSPGAEVEWEAEVINERPNELIAWRTVEGSDVHHAGSIRFTPAPGNLGTEVKITVEYEVSGFAETLARLARRSPEQQIREDMRHFKQLLEAGEIATTEGQSANRDKNMVAKYKEAK